MPLSHTLKQTLKRGALVAAANWPITIIQAIADSLFKLLILAPLVGGIFLVAIVVGEEPSALISLEPRDLATTIATSLLSRPIVLAAWVAALGVVITGGSLFVFLIKGGAVGILLGRGISIVISTFLSWPTIPSLPAVIASVAVAVTVGMIFGYYPARKASRLDPIEALRYE